MEQKQDDAGNAGLALFLGIVVELLSWGLHKFIGILPEPFSHFIPGLGADDNYNVTVLKECLLFSAIILASSVGILVCANKAEALANSKLRPVFLLIGILVVGCAVSYYDKQEKRDLPQCPPCGVRAPQRSGH